MLIGAYFDSVPNYHDLKVNMSEYNNIVPMIIHKPASIKLLGVYFA